MRIKSTPVSTNVLRPWRSSLARRPHELWGQGRVWLWSIYWVCVCVLVCGKRAQSWRGNLSRVLFWLAWPPFHTITHRPGDAVTLETGLEMRVLCTLYATVIYIAWVSHFVPMCVFVYSNRVWTSFKGHSQSCLFYYFFLWTFASNGGANSMGGHCAHIHKNNRMENQPDIHIQIRMRVCWIYSRQTKEERSEQWLSRSPI